MIARQRAKDPKPLSLRSSPSKRLKMKIEAISPEMVTKLSQDPHVTSAGEREKVLEVAIGREVRSFRKQKEITVAELASMTGLSIGMLSKIENGNTSPSLSTLQTLPMLCLFRLRAFSAALKSNAQPCIRKLAKVLNWNAKARGQGISITCLGI